MKTYITYRIIAMTMAFLMFFTSVGFSMDVHYCKGEFKSFSLIGEASSCHSVKKSCPHHKAMQVAEKGDCCSNEQVVFDELDQDFSFSNDIELTELDFLFIQSFVLSLSGVSIPRVVKNNATEDVNQLYPRDIYVLLDRFLL